MSDERERELDTFIGQLQQSLDPKARQEFGDLERMFLIRSMRMCGMREYPQPTGDPTGERSFGDCQCEICGEEYFSHPMDWRVIGYGNVPFLNILCDGRRVKL